MEKQRGQETEDPQTIAGVASGIPCDWTGEPLKFVVRSRSGADFAIDGDIVAQIMRQAPGPAAAPETLGSLPDGEMIDLRRLAAMLGRHPERVKRAVRRGELPPWQRFMGKPSWCVVAIREHMLKRQGDAAKLAARRDARRPK